MKSMELVEFLRFCNVAKKKEQEEKLFTQWCSMLPQMDRYMDFEEFKDVVTGANIDTRPTALIIADIDAAHSKKGGS